MALTYDSLMTSTLQKYASKKLADNIFNSMPLIWWLKKAGQTDPEDGGETIVEPLLN